jgi:predicted dehydrogenase
MQLPWRFSQMRVGLSCGNYQDKEKDMTRHRINLAFVGSGGWARKHHFPALAHLQQDQEFNQAFDLHLQGITSLDAPTAHMVAETYGFDTLYPDLDALLADDAVNAIAVAIPPAALLSVMTRLVTKGVPLFSEKPPGISLEEAQALSRLVDVPNVLAFNRRFIPLNITFRDLVKEMDDVYFVEGHFYRHQRLDENFVIGTGVHWINFMTYLFGDVEHLAVETYRHPENATRNFVAHLTFAGGLPGLLKIFQCAGSQVERLEVHSGAQSAYLDGPLWTNPGSIVVDRGAEQQTLAPESQHPLPEVVRLGIVGEYRTFCDVVAGGAPSPSTFQNSVNTMRVAEAIERGEDF